MDKDGTLAGNREYNRPLVGTITGIANRATWWKWIRQARRSRYCSSVSRGSQGAYPTLTRRAKSRRYANGAFAVRHPDYRIAGDPSGRGRKGGRGRRCGANSGDKRARAAEKAHRITRDQEVSGCKPLTHSDIYIDPADGKRHRDVWRASPIIMPIGRGMGGGRKIGPYYRICI